VKSKWFFGEVKKPGGGEKGKTITRVAHGGGCRVHIFGFLVGGELRTAWEVLLLSSSYICSILISL
jgi:hypothetical protein